MDVTSIARSQKSFPNAYAFLRRAEGAFAPGGRYQDPAAYAMERYAYYVCYKCQKAYYGGEARCDAQLGGESFDPTELVCGGCSDVARAQMCPKHGADFLEYKCRYCCSMAVFFCFGTTHFCKPCHDDFQRVTTIPKNELPMCPAGTYVRPYFRRRRRLTRTLHCSFLKVPRPSN